MPDRFVIEPNWKSADRFDSRNPGGRVRDGFLMTDTVTGVTFRFDRKKDAVQRSEQILRNEASLSAYDAACWGARLPTAVAQDITEVRLYDADGRDVGVTAAVIAADRRTTDEELAGRVEKWMRTIGFRLTRRTGTKK